MLTVLEFDSYFNDLGTPETGRQLVLKASKDGPVRRVQSNAVNVVTRYTSRKTGRRIATESRSLEFSATLMYEFDDSVLDYIPQPVKLDLKTKAASGDKTVYVTHTPDFLLLKKDGIVIEEWRTQERMLGLAQKHPDRYIYQNDEWRQPIVESFLSERGITYRIRTEQDINPRHVANLTFLSDYLSADCPPVSDEQERCICSCFADQSWLTLSRLIELGRTNQTCQFTADEIYKLIASKILAFNICDENIADTHQCKVFRDFTALTFSNRPAHGRPTRTEEFAIEIGVTVLYEAQPYVIALVGDDSVWLNSRNGSAEIQIATLRHLFDSGKLTLGESKSITEVHQEDRLLALSSKEMQRVMERASCLELARNNPDAANVSRRTLQRWKKAVKEAGGSVLSENLALLGRARDRGNRQRRLSAETLEAIRSASAYYNTPTNISVSHAYKQFLSICEEREAASCSLKTFSKELKLLSSVTEREGRKAAYQKSPIIWYLNRSDPIHGARPFQYVHIDHTLIDVQLKIPEVEQPKRAWLTLALDAETRVILGFFLSFEAPSYQSCMMVLRDIVRQHGRMPDMVVVDNGPDFHSAAFEQVCALYGASLRFRPKGMPRHGTVIERVFGTTNTEFLHNLKANTKLMKNARGVSREVRPEQFAEWTLVALHGGLEFYFNSLYGTENHPALGMPPNDYFAQRLYETGARRHKWVKYDKRFAIETCPPADKGGTRIVNAQRGVKVNHDWYWTSQFSRSDMHGKPVEIRVDPWDPGHCYANINGEWNTCKSSLLAKVGGYTSLELRYVYQNLAQKHSIKKKDLTPERLQDWMKVMNASNFDARIRAEQNEIRTVYSRLGMTAVETVTRKTLPVDEDISDIKNLPRLVEHLCPDKIEGIPVDSGGAEDDEYDLF